MPVCTVCGEPAYGRGARGVVTARGSWWYCPDHRFTAELMSLLQTQTEFAVLSWLLGIEWTTNDAGESVAEVVADEDELAARHDTLRDIHESVIEAIRQASRVI